MKTMKAFKSFGKIGVIAMALALSVACSSDDNGGGGGGTGSGSYIKGKVDGVQFKNLEIQGVSSAIATSTGVGDQRLIMMSGSDMETNTMTIIMLGINSTGTYEIDATDDGNVLAWIPSGQISYDTSNCDGASGTLKITKLTDTTVEGTFDFVGKDDENCSATKTITSGSFRGVFMQSN